jgi:hypothetical protein
MLRHLCVGLPAVPVTILVNSFRAFQPDGAWQPQACRQRYSSNLMVVLALKVPSIQKVVLHQKGSR